MESKDINHPHDSMPIATDCTDELMNCTTQCDTHDKECLDDCIEEYHDCEIPGEYAPLNDMNVDEGEIIAEILTLTALLNGKCTRSDMLNSTGRSSKLITIEYDIKERDQGASQETETDQE